MASAFKIVEHIIPGQHIREYSHATSHRQEDTLLIAVKQYLPLKTANPEPDGAVTIIGVHGNGFPKVRFSIPFFRPIEAYLVFRKPMRRSGKTYVTSSNSVVYKSAGFGRLIPPIKGLAGS